MNQSLTKILIQYDKFILVGGWTGWHIQPIVSITKSLKSEKKKHSDILWIWGAKSPEQSIAEVEGINFVSIPTLKLSNTKSWKILLYPWYLTIGFLWAKKILKMIKSKHERMMMFSKWWPGSVAIGIAAWSLWIPLYIHESDTVPGRSNRVLGKFATKIFLGFEWAKQYFNSNKCEAIGQILDPIFSFEFTRISTYQPSITWKTSKSHILVICGSQGSQSVFESIISQFSDNNDYEWIIALGKLNTKMQSEFSKIPDCQALEWISQSDIAHLIQDCDIAITRWSATTLAELTAFEHSPHLIIIPLPCSAGNHQYYNALEYQKKGHTLLEQQYLTSLHNTLSNLIQNDWNTTRNK